MPDTNVTLRLLISCEDRPGIVAAVSGYLAESGANIVRSDQYSTELGGGDFFMRIELTLPSGSYASFAEGFGMTVAEPLHLTWRLWDAARPKRVAILVSRMDQCLLELLWRWRRRELDADIVLVASNHENLRADVDQTPDPGAVPLRVADGDPPGEFAQAGLPVARVRDPATASDPGCSR